jgi:predicted DNA-binding protein with PD1-like motif
MNNFSSKVRAFAFRLTPKSDLKKSILSFAEKKKIKAGAIASCVGSLEQFHLRFANRKKGRVKKGFFEIVSMVGTFSNSSCHLHISVTDRLGKTVGGHLLDGNLIYTTAEVVVLDLADLRFDRKPDTVFMNCVSVEIVSKNDTITMDKN